MCENGIALCADCHKTAHTKIGVFVLMLNYKYFFQMASLEKETYSKYRKRMKISHQKYYKQLHVKMNQILKEDSWNFTNTKPGKVKPRNVVLKFLIKPRKGLAISQQSVKPGGVG